MAILIGLQQLMLVDMLFTVLKIMPLIAKFLMARATAMMIIVFLVEVTTTGTVLKHLVELMFPLAFPQFLVALIKLFISHNMTALFKYPCIEISSTSEVLKSEDGELYNYLFSGGNYTDLDLCIPNKEEDMNYYFYSGDGQISVVEVKNLSI